MAGARVTTWNYDVYRGFLTSKRDANSSGSDYYYSAAGRWLTRARGSPRITRFYAYNQLGDL